MIPPLTTFSADSANLQLDAQFRAFIESAQDIVFALNEYGQLLYLSPNWFHYFGLDADKLRHQTFKDWVHPDDKTACHQLFQKTFSSGESGKLEFRLSNKDGEWEWYEATATLICNSANNSRNVWGVARNIEYQREAVQEIQSLNRLLRALRGIHRVMASETKPVQLITRFMDHLFDQNIFTGIAIGLFDQFGCLYAMENRGNVFNKAVGTILKEGEGLFSRQLPFSYNQQISERLMNQFLPSPIHSYYMDPSGRGQLNLPLKGSNQLHGYLFLAIERGAVYIRHELGLLHEIADDLAHALDNIGTNRAHKRLVKAFEQCHESIIITDVNARIEYVNPAFERISGYRKEECAYKTPAILRSGYHDREFYQNMWRKLLSGGVWSGILHNRSKDGQPFTEEAIISPIFEDGTINGFVAIKKDITEELKWQHSAAHQQRNQIIGQLARGIAHDFNNILTGVMGNLSYLQKYELEPEHPGHESVQSTLKAVYRARDLIHQILQFSRPDEETHTTIHVAQVIKEAVDFLHKSLPEKIQLRTIIETKSDCLFGSSSKLLQILLNLCTNAIQAIGDAHGSICIRLSEITPSLSPHASNAPPPQPEWLLIEVSDTGPGIDKALMERIFEPFFTTKQGFHGTGLGLAIVQNIVDSWNGQIRFRSELGQGCDFIIKLPIAQPEKSS